MIKSMLIAGVAKRDKNLKTREKTLKIPSFKIISYISIILNLFCIISGIFYILFPIYSIFWDLLGVIILISIFNNFIMIIINSMMRSNYYNVPTRWNVLSYIFLILIILTTTCIMLGNLLISVTYSNQLFYNLGAYTLIYLFYFAVMAFGMIYAILGIRIYQNNNSGLQIQIFENKISRGNTKTKIFLKKILTLISRITFIIGILFGIVCIFGSFEFVTTFIAIISGQFGIFFSIIFFGNTILLLKLKHRKWNTRKGYRNIIISVIISGMLMVPLFLTHNTINDIEKDFSRMFSSNWREEIPPNVNQYFLKTPFSLSNYFLGIPPKDCKIEKNTLFYDDEGIRLYFDVYMPVIKRNDLPGINSTIIRIHGGGWVSGDKGLMNMMQMNKYFAAQGYTVFDIQYGIDENPLYALDPLTPNYKKGNFNIDDMMRHIGVFTNYITNHSENYGANLDSVFISGGSAGGHLTCAVALAIASGNYTNIFSTDIKIKGLVPFYPANGQMGFFGVSGSDIFKNPEKLIESNSPPCLIFQGTHDILNYFSISQNIRNRYIAKGNKMCAILWMPLGGHASDFYFTGYYNQIFLYFMERFIYLCH
ncbi:MAG: alpha/beta hydrolase [Promethearchaeota archaeon]